MVSELWSISEIRALSRLNPCSDGTWSRSTYPEYKVFEVSVLILVLMEHGLGGLTIGASLIACLNPCSNGTWSRRITDSAVINDVTVVLILVLMEHGLGVACSKVSSAGCCLNPCSNGTWSRSQYHWEYRFNLSLS